MVSFGSILNPKQDLSCFVLLHIPHIFLFNEFTQVYEEQLHSQCGHYAAHFGNIFPFS